MNILRSPGLSTDSGEAINQKLEQLHPQEDFSMDELPSPDIPTPGPNMFDFID